MLTIERRGREWQLKTLSKQKMPLKEAVLAPTTLQT